MYEKTWVLLENIPEKLVMSSPDAHLEVNLVQSEWTYPSSEGVLKQWMNMLHARALAGQDVRPLAAPAAALATKVWKFFCLNLDVVQYSHYSLVQDCAVLSHQTIIFGQHFSVL